MGTPEKILEILQNTYPDAKCELDYKTPWQLMVATILSAQCTDVRVNKVTPQLFAKYPDAKTMSQAEISDIIEIIRSTGFYNNKAKNIKAAAVRVETEFGGKVPQTISELITISGVARKTANVVLGVAFNVNEGIAVDTHVLRLSQRLGFSKATTPEKVEQDLMKLFPREKWERVSMLLVIHGRRRCAAKKPDCLNCPLKEICPSATY
jgi:endonuclease-3